MMIAFAVISLTSPWMLLGISAVALPIAAHLLNRRARQRVVFPCIKLLAEAAATQSRLFRLRRLVLLALRCLAIALLALAFARPVWLNQPLLGDSPDASTALVIIADASASMNQQQPSGTSLAQHLAAEGLDALDQLEPGRDLANIIFAGARPRPAFDRLVPNLEALRSDLREYEPTAQRAELSDALGLAAAMLSSHDGPARIVVLSDMQRTNWADLVPKLAKLERSEQPIDVIITPLGTQVETNVALSEPRVFPPRPIAGTPAELAVKLTSFASMDRAFTVRATINDTPLTPQQVRIAAGGEQEVRFEALFDQPGSNEVVFTVDDDDALLADGRAYLSVDAPEHVQLGIISDANPSDPSSAAFFLTRALAPTDDGHYRIKHTTTANFDPAVLTRSDAVMITEAAPLSPPIATALHSYLVQGGGVLMLADESAAAANLAAIANAFENPAPALVGRTAPKLSHIDASGPQQSPMAQFDQIARDMLSQIPFQMLHEVAGVGTHQEVLLTYADGSPALISQSVGRGRLLVANFSLSPQRTDLPRHGLFVPLIHTLANHLRPPGRDPLLGVVGRPIALNLPPSFADLDIAAFGPGDRAVPVQRAASAERLALQLAPPLRPGFYRLTARDMPLLTLAVNLDARESDLSRIELPAFAPGGVVQVAESSDSPIAASVGREGRALWPWLVLGAMAAVATELAIVTVWRR